jgi:hypothetical protein
LKRFLLIAILSAIFILVESVTWLGFLMDEIFYPAWRKTAVKAPVFIIGLPRTGSTYFHNLLCNDRGSFTSMKSWELLFAPSIVQKMLVKMLVKLDRYVNGTLSRVMVKLDRIIFIKNEPIHNTSFFNYEEDDYLFLHIFSALILIFFFPRARHLHSLIRFDDEVSSRKKRILMAFYSCCIRKHLYYAGKERTYLAKGPQHSARIGSLNRAFPDCRLIYMIRQPERTIPSSISMFVNFSKMYMTNVDTMDINNHAFEMADYWYHHPLQVFNRLPRSRYFIIVYDDLIKNARDTVLSVYDHFGIVPSMGFEEFLEGELSKSFGSLHRYSSEKFGLTDSELKLRYLGIYEEYLQRARNRN